MTEHAENVEYIFGQHMEFVRSVHVLLVVQKVPTVINLYDYEPSGKFENFFCERNWSWAKTNP